MHTMTYISGGFDLRVPIESVGDDVTLDDQFLVPELRNRVSTDPLVWPRPTEVSEIHASEIRSFPLGVPSDLGDIVTALYERGLSGIMVTPVALVVSDITVAELCRGGWVSHFENARQQDDLSREGWHYVGFDVAELNGLCSGLKGYGYKQPLWSELLRSDLPDRREENNDRLPGRISDRFRENPHCGHCSCRLQAGQVL